MRVINCVCGERLEAVDSEALYAALVTHNKVQHPEVELPPEVMQQAERRLGESASWDGRAHRLAADIEIRELTPSLVDDYLGFFDRDAFMDNPGWASCYCYFWQFPRSHEEWEQSRAEQNREAKAALIRGGKAHGVMAYAAGKPVAWCHAAPKLSLPLLIRDEDVRGDHDDEVGSIVCFVVAAPYRRQGLATQLLDAACDSLERMGLSIAEAYPPKASQLSDARMYMGPLALYKSAGFEEVRQLDDSVVVRKALGAAPR